MARPYLAHRNGIVLALLSTVVALVACAAPSSSPGPRTNGEVVERPAVRKHLVVGMPTDPAGLHQELTNPTGSSGSVRGLDDLQDLMHAGAAYLDDQDVLQPRLAEAVPTIDNGLWKIFADGTMETSWHLRPGTLWHDGTPFTADDLVFGVQVNRDKEMGIANPAGIDLIDSIEAPDARTVVARWKAPFIEADSLFTTGFAMPLPRHLLGQAFSDDKTRFLGLPYWRDAYVGVGPYRMQGWVPGSQILLTANDDYVLGRPKIDEIEVRFITDTNAMVANFLAGSIYKTLGAGGLKIEHGIQLRDATDQVRVALGERLGSVLPMYPQFLNPEPAVLANVEFRRALLQAIDRQELNETINFGLGAVADSWLQPDRVEYPAVASSVVRYAFDPRRAMSVLESLGYAKGPDGFVRDTTGQGLSIELRTIEENATQVRSLFPIAEAWKHVGIDVDTVVIPSQRAGDREYRATFTGVTVLSSTQSVRSAAVRQYHSSSAPTPANRFQGSNRARYMSPVLDAMIDRYVTTIPMQERLSALAEVIHLQTDQLSLMPLFYQASASVFASVHLQGVTGDKAWNAHLWSLD